MLLGIVFVDFYGVIVKFLGNKYPSPQLAFFRNFFALIPIIFLVGFISISPKTRVLIGTAFDYWEKFIIISISITVLLNLSIAIWFFMNDMGRFLIK